MNLTLEIWRQESESDKGKFAMYSVNNIPGDASFLEMLDVLNEQLVQRGVKAEVPKSLSIIVVALLILTNLLAYLQRSLTPSDVWFFWIPFVVLGLYLAALKYKIKRIKVLQALV